MSYSSQVLADGAVGYWRLGEASSGSAAVDAAGNQNGVYTNTAGVTVGQAGIPGDGGDTAVKFTAASSGYVAVADNAAQHLGGVHSIEAWIKRTATLAANMNIIAGATNGHGPRLFLNTSNQLQGDQQNTSNMVLSSGTIGNDGIFHHVVWTCAGGLGSQQKVYIDGVDSTGTTTNQSGDNNAVGYDIGFLTWAGVWAFDGTIDEVALYPSALTPTQVANHHTLGATAPSTYAPLAHHFGATQAVQLAARRHHR